MVNKNSHKHNRLNIISQILRHRCHHPNDNDNDNDDSDNNTVKAEGNEMYSLPSTPESDIQQSILSNISMGQLDNTQDARADDIYFQKLASPLPLHSTIMSSFVGIFVAVGGFLYGYDTGLINSLTDMKFFKSHIAPNKIEFTSNQMAILVSFLSLGTFFGALIAPWFSDKYGRRPTIILSTAIIFSIGNSLQVGANNLTLLVVGRVISGFSIGISSAVVPLYQAEAAQKNLRGAIISTYQFAITIGLLVSSAVGQSTKSRNDASSYRIPIGLQYVWSTFLAVGMYFLPESPRYYVMKDEINKAAKSLAFLRGIDIQDPRLLEELVEIKATYDYEASFGKATFVDCFKSSENRPKQVLRMITGIGLEIMQQFSGINFIFYYGVHFFNYTGVKNSYVISFITYAVNVAFNIPGMFLVEKLGRRKLLLCGAICMTIANFIVASVGFTVSNDIGVKVTITFICVFVAAFSSTWGGVVWVVSAELYPLGVRSKCTAICVAANWLVNFICAYITPYVSDTTGGTISSSSKIFFIWASLNALSIFFVYFTVYETRGLTLEEIDELYRKSPTCFTSTDWNKNIRERPLVYHQNEATDLLHDIEVMNSNAEGVIATGVDIPTSKYGKNHIDGFLVGKQEQETRETEIDISKTFTYVVPGIACSTIESPSTTDIADVENNYVDLGNGLGLNTYNRGPPSILTDSTDGSEYYEEDLGSSSYDSNTYDPAKDSHNVFQVSVVDDASNTSSRTSFSNNFSETSSTPLYSTFVNQVRNHPRTNSSAAKIGSSDWMQYLASQSDASSNATS